jgi:hypothetical protein
LVSCSSPTPPYSVTEMVLAVVLHIRRGRWPDDVRPISSVNNFCLRGWPGDARSTRSGRRGLLDDVRPHQEWQTRMARRHPSHLLRQPRPPRTRARRRPSHPKCQQGLPRKMARRRPSHQQCQQRLPRSMARRRPSHQKWQTRMARRRPSRQMCQPRLPRTMARRRPSHQQCQQRLPPRMARRRPSTRRGRRG